jgi:hypothetical protein
MALSARINLAPEVYQKGQRDKRRRRIATTLSIMIGSAAIGITVVSLLIVGGQKVAISLLGGNVKTLEQQFDAKPNIQAAVTTQEHLASLGNLYSQRVYLSKFLQVLQSVVPQNASVSQVSIDNSNNVQVTATAKTYNLATKFTDAIIASNVEVGPDASTANQPYFSNVQLGSVGSDASASQNNSGVNFKITAQMASGVTSGQ